jgi:hypothetical protein
VEARNPASSGEMEGRMRRATLPACLACLTAPALAETAIPGGPPLDARAFDALTLGKRMNTFDPLTH